MHVLRNSETTYKLTTELTFLGTQNTAQTLSLLTAGSTLRRNLNQNVCFRQIKRVVSHLYAYVSSYQPFSRGTVCLGLVSVGCIDVGSVGRGLNPSHPAVECNPGQVVNTHVPLSPSSIIWYQAMGGDALWLGR